MCKGLAGDGDSVSGVSDGDSVNGDIDIVSRDGESVSGNIVSGDCVNGDSDSVCGDCRNLTAWAVRPAFQLRAGTRISPTTS
jgi:hypothetical protein